ncbi:MAG: potassium-transporting ATPase subunit F [Firmicutes bacterium]|nr:potassium-transporting ATPase subunit F [Bacillota bacterium]
MKSLASLLLLLVAVGVTAYLTYVVIRPDRF